MPTNAKNCLLIIKTQNGYITTPISSATEIDLDFDNISVAEQLLGRYGGTHDGVIGILRNFFEPTPATTPEGKSE